MYVDEALRIVLDSLDEILIPSRESKKMEDVKNGIRAVIASVKTSRAQEAKKAQEAMKAQEQPKDEPKEEEKHEDDHDQQE